MPRSMSRRQFLITSGVVSGAALAAGATGCSVHHLVAAGKKTPMAVGTKILVLVTMYGGNDGLNTLIPYTDKAYYAGRPELAYEEADVLPLADDLGLNPSMTGFKKLYDAGQLAVVRGVGARVAIFRVTTARVIRTAAGRSDPIRPTLRPARPGADNAARHR